MFSQYVVFQQRESGNDREQKKIVIIFVTFIFISHVNIVAQSFTGAESSLLAPLVEQGPARSGASYSLEMAPMQVSHLSHLLQNEQSKVPGPVCIFALK